MVIKKIKSFLRIVLILLGLGSFGFQLVNLVFGTMVKSSSDRMNEWSYYLFEFIPHLFTILICIWFVIYQMKLLSNKEK